MEMQIIASKALPTLDHVRSGLAEPARRRTPIWVLLLAAMLAAGAGVSVAAVMIFGPGAGQSAMVRAGPINH